MSILLDDTTLALNTKVTVSTEGYSFADLDWIEFTNSSPFSCKIATGGNTLLLPAWYVYPIPLHDERGNVLPGLALPFTVTPYLQTIPGSGSVNTLHTVLYVRGETPKSTLPAPLGGGPIDLTIASQIISTNQAAGTNIVFAEPIGDTSPGGATAITNSGFIGVGDTSNSGKIQLSGTHVALAATNNLFPDEINILGTSSQEVDLLVSGTDASLTLKNQSGANVVSLSTATGLGLLLGTVTRVSKFTGTATTVSTFFNHNLGVVPDIVMLCLNGVSSTAHSITADYASMTTTQVKLTADGNNVFVGLAIKF